MTSDISTKPDQRRSNLRSISSIVAHKSRRLFLTICSIQVVAMLCVVIFLTFFEGVKRAHFLSESSDTSIGFMISTGDLFQLRTTAASFLNEETVGAAVLDESGKVIFSKESGSEFELIQNQSLMRLIGFNLFLRTEHAINFNNHQFGKLILLNRLKIYDWLLMCGIFLSLIVVFFFLQNQMQASVSQEIGSYIRNLGTFFENAKNRDDLDSYYNSRKRSNFSEVEDLADKIKVMLALILEASTLEKQAAVGRIIAQLTHDIRAPLGIFERFLNGPQDHENHGQMLRDALNRLYAMVEALRHSETEHLIDKSITSLNFQHGLQSLQHQANSRNVQLKVPTEVIEGLNLDSAKVERAWINLASNAIDAARSLVEVDVRIIEDDLLLRVIDDGPGVPEKFLPKLFERGATYGKADGTGLGLAYVRQIMRGHGGDVTYRRDKNLTVFECRLPNVLQCKKEVSVENTPKLEAQLAQQMVQSVAICLKPDSLNKFVLAELNSLEMDDFLFSEERASACIVVSNTDEVMFEVLERDDQEYVSLAHLKDNEEAIMKILKRKFNLDKAGSTRA